jgi:putative transposase
VSMSNTEKAVKDNRRKTRRNFSTEEKLPKALRGAGSPYHPQTQGKIERYHRSMKNEVKLENYYYPWELEKAIAEWVDHHNHERYHESLDKVTPAGVCDGRRNDILEQHAEIKFRTLTQRKVHNLQLAG